MEKEELQKAIDEIPYWYHKIELPHGVTTERCNHPGWAPINAKAYRIPERMDGERVLDVGSWDGYWTWEAAKRGAVYTIAIDDFSDELGPKQIKRTDEWKTWLLCQKALGFERSTQCLSMSVYDIGKLQIEPFDHIFLFGTLYHLKHPTWALEQLRKVCRGAIYIESAILDNIESPYTKQGMPGGACHCEFYPGKEYGNNETNWNVPTLSCIKAWLEGTGWTDVETWKLTDNPMSLAHCRGFAKARVA